jgi:hypothetical protein
MTTAAVADETPSFPISFDSWYGVLSGLVGLRPSRSYLALGKEQIEVRMGWAFRSRFPRSAIASAVALDMQPLSRGVHGFGGRWLVNGSSRGILSIRLVPGQHAYVMGVRVQLRELLVSVSEPSTLARRLGAAQGG